MVKPGKRQQVRQDDRQQQHAKQAAEQRIEARTHQPMSRGVEQVTLTANGLDQLRGFRVIAEFLAQARDQQIDAAIKGLDRATARGVQQLFAAEHPARTFDEHPEQAEFGVGQRHHQAIGGDQLAQHAVQAPVVEANIRTLFGAIVAHPTQNGLNPRHQFRGSNGLAM